MEVDLVSDNLTFVANFTIELDAKQIEHIEYGRQRQYTRNASFI